MKWESRVNQWSFQTGGWCSYTPGAIPNRPSVFLFKEKMMCLSLVYKGKEKANELAKLPNMITCWKTVLRQGNQYGSIYYSCYRSWKYSIGLNKTKPFWNIYPQYKIAFHAFLTKRDAQKYKSDRYESIVKCRTEKKDIVAIGKQAGKLVIVTKRIWIPKPKKKTA